MASPTENYDPLLVTEINTRSPVSPGVMAKIRESIIHLYEVLYGDAFVAPIIGHNHDGVNSALVDSRPGEGFIWFSNPPQIVNTTTSGSYQNVDITAHVAGGDTAKIAIVQVYMDYLQVTVTANSAAQYGAYTRFRNADSVENSEKNVSTGVFHQTRTTAGGGQSVEGEHRSLIFVELNSLDQYEYQVTLLNFPGGTLVVTSQHHLVAYIR